jgi:HD-like signal output (HDOD) protein
LVNSAFFGLRQQVTTAEKAVALLGIETVKSLVLSVQIFSQFSHWKDFKTEVSRLWAHSVATGQLAKQIAAAEQTTREIQDQSFMAGLLHDCGKLVLMDNFPGRMKAVIAECRKSDAGELALERQIFEVTHASVGGYLLGMWGLPDPVISAIYLHHTPSLAADKTFSALPAVHIANHLNRGPMPPPEAPTASDTLDTDYLSKMGWMDHWARWRDIVM